MRETGKIKPKKHRRVSLAAKFLIAVALILAIIIGAFIAWVFYGGKEDGSTHKPAEVVEEEKNEVAVLDIAADWSVPNEAFAGSNGNGRFDSEKVKNVVDTQVLYEKMGVDEKDPQGKDKVRVEAVQRFLDGIYYDADNPSGLSNGDTVTVTIMSKEEASEIEREAGIKIEGLGDSKDVTVAGLPEKFSYYDISQEKDLLDAAKRTAEKRIRKSTAKNHQEIFKNASKYNTELTFYGMYLAKPQDQSKDDMLIVLYRLSSTYPDSDYDRWTQEGDYVNTYEMTHFDNINKSTTVEDIEKGLSYDSFRYENLAYEVLEWYRQDLDESTTYTIQQIAYN